MAEGWYPVIDEELCNACGICVELCRRKVFFQEQGELPRVETPERCIRKCRACADRCPLGAIRLKGSDSEASSCCCCGGNAQPQHIEKKLRVDYLYLDLKTCERCMSTEDILRRVLTVLAPALHLAGYSIELRKTEIRDEKMAEQYHFLSSPTVLVNGRDILGPVQEGGCSCCSEIAGTDIDCRTFSYAGGTFDAPPEEMLADAILCSLDGSAEERKEEPYRLPDNLRRFFEGKARKGK